MFKLGEYYEGEAKSIAKCLKNGGMKVELKTCLCAATESTNFLEGKLSELKGEIENIEIYERYLAVLKSALDKAGPEDDLRDLFLSLLDPLYLEKKKKIDEIHELSLGLPLEEGAAAEEKVNEEDNKLPLDDIAEWIVASDFALTTLSRNDIDTGDDAADLLADPILRIRIDPNKYEGNKSIKQTVSVGLDKRSELYIDEFSSPLFEDLDEEFQKSYPEEFLQIMALGLLIADLSEEPSSGKTDLQSFVERLDLEMENDGDILCINGSEAVDEIARILEKNDVIKRKGNIIKWKNKSK